MLNCKCKKLERFSQTISTSYLKSYAHMSLHAMAKHLIMDLGPILGIIARAINKQGLKKQLEPKA